MTVRNQLTAAVLAGSFAAALALVATPASAQWKGPGTGPKPARADMDKCYGIALKEDNDCAAGPGWICRPRHFRPSSRLLRPAGRPSGRQRARTRGQAHAARHAPAGSAT